MAILACSALMIVAILMTLSALASCRRRRRFDAALQDARGAADEYQRARDAYLQLMQHRIGNPLAVLYGAARTMDDFPDLPPATRQALVRSMLDAASELADVSIDPVARRVEEQSLHPQTKLRLLHG